MHCFLCVVMDLMCLANPFSKFTMVIIVSVDKKIGKAAAVVGLEIKNKIAVLKSELKG